MVAAMGSLFLLLCIASLLAGVILVVLGIRGAPRFSAPRCARCGYDLRAINFLADESGRCPECGADLHTPDAVKFGRYQRQPRRILLGLGLCVLAMMLPAVGWYVSLSAAPGGMGISPAMRSRLSTPQLLANLPATVDQPWDWNELESRLDAGQLSAQDADAAISVLVNHLNQQRAAGEAPQPLHWSGSFVHKALAAGKISPESILALCQAFFSDEPQIILSSSVRTDRPIACTVQGATNPWDLAGHRGVWALRSVSADGKALSIRNRIDERSDPDLLSGLSHSSQPVVITHDLPPGEHELTFTFDYGAIARDATLRGTDGKPGIASKWPSPAATWEMTARRKIRVVAPGEQVVALATDPAQNPLAQCPPTLREAVARPSRRGVELVIRWQNHSTAPRIPICYRVTIIAGQQKIPLGTYLHAGQEDGGVYSQLAPDVTVASLAAEITRIDLLFTPDPATAETVPGINQIWGEPFQLKNVPLERADLPDSAQRQ